MTFDEYIRAAMRAAALKKLADNDNAEALDAIPHDPVAVACAAAVTRDELKRAKPLEKEALALAYRKSLESIGMSIDESGRYKITAPEPTEWTGYMEYVGAPRRS